VASDDDRWITFADILRTVSIHWPRILAAGLILGGLCAIAVLFMPTVYADTALVMIDEQQNRVFDSRTDPSVLSDLPSDPSSIESQVQMLESHALIGRVVDRLGLAKDTEFNGARRDWFGFEAGAAPAGVARAADGLERRLGLGPKPKTQDMARAVHVRTTDAPGISDSAQRSREIAIGSVKENLNAQIDGRFIAITFRSQSAIKAALIANAIAGSYVDGLTEARSAASEGVARWPADRVTKLGRRAAAADAAVQLYKIQNGLLDTSTGTALTDQKRGDLAGQLIAAEGERVEAQAKLAWVKQLVRSGKNADVTEVVDSPLIAQLREHEATLLQQKAGLSSRYGDRSPRMVSLETQLNVLEQKIDEEAARIVSAVADSVVVADAQVQAIRREMAGATSTASTQNDARVKLRELAGDAASAHALYLTYLDRPKQTQEQTGLKSADAHVASPASVPLAPISPKSAPIIGGGTLGGLLLGFLFAIMADRMCNGFRSLQKLQSVTGLPVLAILPELSRRRPRKAALEVVCRPHSEFSEAVHALEISLARSYVGGRGAKVFAVMSALPGEGKTVTAVSVARRLAIYGKRVVLVDGDLRRPNVSMTLGVSNTRYDLGDYLSRRCLLDEAICADPHSSLLALPASRGLKVSDEGNHSAMAALIQHLRGISDIVIIDTPPVLAVQDALLLAELSDGALFVIRWAKTSREAVLRALKLLRDFGIPLVGTSLVRTQAQYQRFYSNRHTGLRTLAHFYKS
jgi:capsular exopolysaccharide synthesis family protein